MYYRFVCFLFLYLTIGRISAIDSCRSLFKSKVEFNLSTVNSLFLEGDKYITLNISVNNKVQNIVVSIDDYLWTEYKFGDFSKKEIYKDTLYKDIIAKYVEVQNPNYYQKHTISIKQLAILNNMSTCQVIKKYAPKNFITTKDKKLVNTLIYYFLNKLIVVAIDDISGRPVINLNRIPTPN